MTRRQSLDGAAGRAAVGSAAKSNWLQPSRYAAALRIAQFHTSNEFGDWDTALHTFTFANAIHQGLRRAPSAELLRGVFDAAMSVYLDRFLNIPAARLPQPDGRSMIRRRAGRTAGPARPPAAGQRGRAHGGPVSVQRRRSRMHCWRVLGKLLLREDRDFHTIQTVEAAFRQYQLRQPDAGGEQCLIAAARYLAAHAPTMRAQGQTFQIARRLHRGEKLFEE